MSICVQSDDRAAQQSDEEELDRVVEETESDDEAWLVLSEAKSSNISEYGTRDKSKDVREEYKRFQSVSIKELY